MSLPGSDVHARCATREKSSFECLYDRHVRRVYGFLDSRLPARDEAEDLTQTTFEHALAAWSRFDPRRGSEATWLLAIARNLLVDHYRSDRSDRYERIDERVLPMIPGPEHPGPQQGFSNAPELIDALDQLGGREREVLALRFGRDLGGPDIATRMGLSLANVQQIMSRSLRGLRIVMEESRAYPQQ